MINRRLAPCLAEAARSFPAVTLTGPRQSGKSTLCRHLFPEKDYVNLEAPDVRTFALEDPRGFFAQYPNGAILDEVQRTPDLPSYLQPMIDDDPEPGKWILTGSQNFALLESVNQSLAGRSAVLNLLPMSFDELSAFPDAPKTLDRVLFTGGYPRIYDKNLSPSQWLASYVATYIERDVRSVSNVGDLTTFQRFVELCAGRTGQMINYSNLASDVGIAQPTAKAWMSILEASYIVFLQPAYSTNLRKRLVKMPKLHFYDTGLACWLLGLRSADQLATHPLKGSIFESWVVSEIVKHRVHSGESPGLFHYRDHRGVEADLILEHADRLIIGEAKAGQTVTSDLLAPIRNVARALGESKETEQVVVFGGQDRQQRSDALMLPWREIHDGPWL